MRLILVCLFLTFLCFESYSKTSKVYPDAGSWNTINLDYVLSKKWTLVFTEELRFRENYGRLNLLYTNIGFEYKLNKSIKTSIVYRWIDKFVDDNSFSFRHRLMWDITAKLPLTNKWSLAYRHRLQMEYRDIRLDYYGKIPEWYSRNKAELGYQINQRLSAGISIELRYQLYNRRFESSQSTWHRVRYQAGIDYKISDDDKVGAYYLIQREFNIAQPQKIYITGLEYSHRFKRK